MMKFINFRIDEIKNEPERKVITELNKDSRTSNWSCFYSLKLTNHINQNDGEIDFLILAPNLGIFVVEIKGGRVFNKNNVWYCGQHKINKKPYDQAHDNYYSLNKMLEDENLKLFRDYCSTYCVICLNYDDEKNLTNKDSIYDSSNYYKKQKYYDFFMSFKNRFINGNRNAPNQNVIDEIVNLLSKNNSNNDENNSDELLKIDEINKKLESLTSEQEKLLTMLNENDRILVHGTFGTGKTILATSYALKCHENGLKTAIVVYNDLIAIQLSKCFNNCNNIKIIQIKEYQKECLIKYTGFDDKNFKNNSERYLSIDRETNNHLDIFKPCFDVIIADECQDYFDLTSLKVIDKLLINGLENGKWLFLGDFVNQLLFNQKLDNFYEESLKLLWNNFNLKGKFTIFSLTNNCRNNYEIKEEIDRLLGYYKDNIDLNEIKNKRKRVEYIEYRKNDDINSIKNQLNLIENKISELVLSGVKPKQISILTYRNWHMEDDDKNIVSKIKKYVVLPKKNDNGHCITHSTFRRYKGLENDIIIIADIDEILFDKEENSIKLNEIRDRFICAISRARTRVIIFETREARDIREELFYKGRVNW